MSGVMKDVQGIVIGMGIVGLVIVLLAIIFINTKPMAVCSNLAYPTYNASTNNCLNSTYGAVAVNSNGVVIDNILTAIQTPVTYFALIVLVVIFVFLLGFLIKKLSGAGKQPNRD